MGSAPYAAVIRLVLYASARWDHLQAQHPHVDLLGLSFHKLLSILYHANVEDWYRHEMKDRPPGMPELTYLEFDAQLEAPLPFELSGRERPARGEFMGDYTALMGQ